MGHMAAGCMALPQPVLALRALARAPKRRLDRVSASLNWQGRSGGGTGQVMYCGSACAVLDCLLHFPSRKARQSAPQRPAGHSRPLTARWLHTTSEGEQQMMSTVRAVPPSESCSTRVSLESLQGGKEGECGRGIARGEGLGTAAPAYPGGRYRLQDGKAGPCLFFSCPSFCRNRASTATLGRTGRARAACHVGPSAHSPRCQEPTGSC